MTTPTKPPAKPRWVWLKAPDGARVLAFTYVDRTAGPSAKGANVGTPPSPEDVRRAVDFPDRTFREPRKYGAMPLRAEEVLRLGLPADPPWIGHFEDKPIPPPRGEPSRVVTGRVLADGVPLAGARVRLGKLYGLDFIRLDTRTSDASGRFEFPLAPLGPVTVIADVDDASTRHVTTAEDSVELALVRTGAITGEVWRAGALAEGQISIEGRDGEPHRVQGTRGTGRYRIDGVVPGRYEIRATALDDGHMPNGIPVIADIEVGAGETVSRDFTLTVGTAVHIVVHLEHDDERGNVYLATGAISPRDSGELKPLVRGPLLRSANSLSIKDRVMTTRFNDVGPGEYTVCVTPWDRAGSGAPEQPVVSHRVVVDALPQTVELALPRLVPKG